MPNPVLFADGILESWIAQWALRKRFWRTWRKFTHGGVLRFGSVTSLKGYVEDHPEPAFTFPAAAADGRETMADDVVRESPAPVSPDILPVATAISDIEALLNELKTARDGLEAEAARVQHANVRYEGMANVAASSARQTAEILRQWLHQERLAALSDDD